MPENDRDWRHEVESGRLNWHKIGEKFNLEGLILTVKGKKPI
jgi:hypothetical protein